MIRFDCHAHIYGEVSAIAAARYVPSRPALLEDWLACQKNHGLHGGIIVQVSFLGIDNTQLLDALESLDPKRFAGVAVVPLDIPGPELLRLRDGGVRGLRWNLVAGAEIPDLQSPEVRAFVRRIRDAGLHLELQLESRRLAGLLPGLMNVAGPFVIDHMGLPESADVHREPWLVALADLADRRDVHVKLSAPYRGTVDPAPHVTRLLQLLPPDRFVWGSDWPHTRFEAEATYAGRLEETRNLVDDAIAAHRLYGLSPLSAA